MSYKWVKSSPLTRVHGEDVEPNERFEPTDAELRSFGDVIEEVEDSDDNPGVTSSESDESTDAYICGVETANGECSRSVDGPDERCWQHSD